MLVFPNFLNIFGQNQYLLILYFLIINIYYIMTYECLYFLIF
jgi:hypothetical protein